MAINPLRLRKILVGAIVAAFGVLVYPKGRSVFHWSTSDPGDVVPVLVADRYIPAFTVIKPDLVCAQEFPKGFVPPGALRAKTELRNENEQMLFTSVIAIPEGQPITRALVADAAQNDALGSLIRPGKVAVSFEIDKAHGVGGWIRPGDTIALFGSEGKKTRLLLSAVGVLAVDAQRLGQGKTGDAGTGPASSMETASVNDAKIITVLVSPAEASRIIEAREEGNLSVVLRSLGDDLPWPRLN